MLPSHHTLAVVAVFALADEPFQHRGLCLLGLQEQGIVQVAALHQEDPTPGPDTADAHHLARHVHVAELFDRVVLLGPAAPV